MEAEPQHVLEVPTAPGGALEGLDGVFDASLGGHVAQDILNISSAGPGVVSPSQTYSILAGSFRSLSLALLAFSPLNNTLRCVQRIEGFGPHQYLAGASAAAASAGQVDTVFTTSWATPPILSSWRVLREDGGRAKGVEHVENVPISATSSYITIPPPYDFIYSVGGPTGEVNAFDSYSTLEKPEAPPNSPSLFGTKVQHLLFIPPEELEKADKTRVALRYGSHGIELSSSGYAFVPVLGTDSIEMYKRELESGRLVHLSSNGSPRGKSAGDGPRHVKVHPNGKVVYCVTEHTNFLDVYEIVDSPPSLRHISSHSILPPHLRTSTSSPSHDTAGSSSTGADPHLKSVHRGGTLMLTPPTSLHPAPQAILATTRGASKNVKGWVSLFRLDEDGRVVIKHDGESTREKANPESEDENYVIRYETPTSTGKANALDVRAIPSTSNSEDKEGVWIILTDDDVAANKRGAVRVLEWRGWGTSLSASNGGLRVVAEWPSGSPSSVSAEDGDECHVLQRTEGTLERDENGAEQLFRGASHAIWLD
ncbi:hypothetical protein BKA70DRAFT_1561599 [Coprinopsis sp. MPI-PUGE-AT-0042]|nr:hypothetical protein BKA70DRAFT_1561599 [Coprinopsis sp. MPI-PUGE-AT-0042]